MNIELERFLEEQTEFIGNVTITDSISVETLRDICERYCELKKMSVVNKSIPDFISEQTCKMVVELWDAPNINNSNPRVVALKLIGAEGEKNGFRMDLKKMGEIKDLILLTYNR
jgi:hypothetical protein